MPWANVQALRRRGVDARLVVFNRYQLHSEADWSLERRGGLVRRQATQWSALAATPAADGRLPLLLRPDARARSPSSSRSCVRSRKKSVMHYLGSDIRGKTPGQLAFGKKAGAEVVGSYDAIRWVPEAEMIPPGIDLDAIEPARRRIDRGPVILHAPSSRRRKGTEHVIAACDGLDADLVLVEGLHHDEAFERYREADIVVDQLNAGWYGLFAIECMALGKPVVTFLHDEAVRRTERELRRRAFRIVRATKETLRETPRAARRLGGGTAKDRRRVARVRRAGPRPRAGRRPPARSLRSPLMSSLGAQLKRLGKHSVIYGLGGLVSRILAVISAAAVHAVPVALGLRQGRDAHRADDGDRDRAPHGDLERVLPFLLRLPRAGGTAPRPAHLVLVHDGRWRPRACSWASRFAARSHTALFGSSDATRRSSRPPSSASGRR